MTARNVTTTAPSLLGTVLPRGGVASKIAAVVLGSVLLAVSAKVQVPFWPVPMTMQTLVVLMIGMAYGSRLGMATVALYLAEGFVGLPVFAGAGAGPAYFMGPTAGYLAGFVLSAGVLGLLAERGWDRSLPRTLVAMTVGHLVIFVPGVLWLSTLFGMEKAIAVGFVPFIAATVLKTLLGTALVKAAWGVAGSRTEI